MAVSFAPADASTPDIIFVVGRPQMETTICSSVDWEDTSLSKASSDDIGSKSTGQYCCFIQVCLKRPVAGADPENFQGGWLDSLRARNF